MRHTLKAVFENRSDAQHVLEELLASGYTHGETTISSDTSAEDAADGVAHDGHDEGLAASVRHTLSRLFGAKHHEGAVQAPADGTHGHHVIMFATESEPEAERAASIIGSFHPTGIEESHEQSGQLTDGAYLPGVAAMGTVYPPGTEPGVLQFRAHEDSRYFGTQNAEAPPASTFQETMGSGTPWAHPDEEVAYRFGKDMAASETYGDRSWAEAESALQSGWERRHAFGESLAWHRIKEAVRRGWERARSR